MIGTVWCYCPICPSMSILGNDYLTPNFRAGPGDGWAPRSQNFAKSLSLDTCGAQSSNLILQEICHGPPAPPLNEQQSIKSSHFKFNTSRAELVKSREWNSDRYDYVHKAWVQRIFLTELLHFYTPNRQWVQSSRDSWGQVSPGHRIIFTHKWKYSHIHDMGRTGTNCRDKFILHCLSC